MLFSLSLTRMRAINQLLHGALGSFDVQKNRWVNTCENGLI